MSNYVARVQRLIDSLPADYNETSITDFTTVLAAYRKILDELSDLREEYIRKLWDFYSKLRTTESSMSTLYQLKKQKQKESAFQEARKTINNDLESLLAILRH